MKEIRGSYDLCGDLLRADFRFWNLGEPVQYQGGLTFWRRDSLSFDQRPCRDIVGHEKVSNCSGMFWGLGLGFHL